MDYKSIGLIVAVGALFFVPGEAATEDQRVRRELWAYGEQYVRLEPQDTSPQGVAPALNDHPVTLTEEVLGKALAQLEILGSKGTSWFSDSSVKSTPVFTATELEEIVPKLSAALARAKPSEDVTFVVIGMHPGLLSKERQAIGGRLFYRSGKLNLILGDLHRPLAFSGGQDVRGANLETDRRLHPFLPGVRNSNRVVPWRIANNRAFSFAGSRDRLRHDWLIFDLDMAAAPIPSSKSQSNSVTPTAGAAPAKNGTRQHGSERSPQERLRTLKELKDEGLIDEREFQTKRRMILEEL